MSCLSCSEFILECQKAKYPKPRPCPRCHHYLKNPDHIEMPARTHDRISCIKCETNLISCPTKYKSGHTPKCSNSYAQVKNSLIEKEYTDMKENLPPISAEISQGQKIIDLLNKAKIPKQEVQNEVKPLSPVTPVVYAAPELSDPNPNENSILDDIRVGMNSLLDFETSENPLPPQPLEIPDDDTEGEDFSFLTNDDDVEILHKKPVKKAPSVGNENPSKKRRFVDKFEWGNLHGFEDRMRNEINEVNDEINHLTATYKKNHADLLSEYSEQLNDMILQKNHFVRILEGQQSENLVSTSIFMKSVGIDPIKID